MHLDDAPNPGRTCWVFLPEDIRRLILEEITRQRHRGWASLAAVSKEWQAFIEKRNFRQLKLQAACLDQFQYMASRQRGLVRHIQLDIELQKYACPYCESYDPSSLTVSNNAIIRDAIWKLFSVLSTWKPTNNLSLDLSAHSPSDSEHWFKNFQFVPPAKADDEAATCRQDNGKHCQKWHDPKHGWVNGRQVKAPPDLAILRLFGTISLEFQNQLPQVSAVTSLIIRRQLRHSLHHETLQLLLAKLCRLEHVVYEPWQIWDSWERNSRDQELSSVVLNHLPRTVRTLSLFEDTNENLAKILASSPLFAASMDLNSIRVADPITAAAFAFKSLSLEQLFVSYMINAEDFFHACLRTWNWQHLESLALTSQLLRQAGVYADICNLLCDAGSAALRMPKLRTMVLWNGKRDNACAFIYHTQRDHSEITWRGTWDLELSPCVKVWQHVASKVHSRELRVHKQRIESPIGSHGDAIYHLKLPCQVVSPESLRQIRRETVY